MTLPDLDPPAFAQPTQPPPSVSLAPVALPAETQPPPNQGPSRARYIGGALLAVAGAAIGGYVMVASHGVEATAAAAHVAAPALASRPADLLGRIDQVMMNLPRETADQACSIGEDLLPVVVYAPAEARAAKQALSAAENLVLSSATPLEEINQKLQTAHRVALVRTVELTEPTPSVGVATPGRYEGQLVVVDTTTGAPLCHTRVVAWSSSVIDQPGLDKHTVRDDFVTRVRTALSSAGSRLHVGIDL